MNPQEMYAWTKNEPRRNEHSQLADCACEYAVSSVKIPFVILKHRTALHKKRGKYTLQEKFHDKVTK